MAAAIDRIFLDASAKRLEELLSRITDCVGKLTPDQIWARGADNQNAVGNLVLHLSGNVRQWIISGVGGEKDVRERDAEFAARGGVSAAQLVERIELAVRDASAVLASLTAERLSQRVTIQKYDVTVLEAIYHVVEHFSHHTGQIIFATKMFTGEDLGYYKHLSAGVHKGKAS